VQAFNRISSQQPIRVRAGISTPNIVLVLDPGLLGITDVTSGLKDNGVLIINTRKSFEDIEAGLGSGRRLALIDATSTARELLGVPIVNTTMLGALVRATGVVKLESLFEPLEKRFGRLAEKNINAMKKAYQETLLKEK